MLNNKTKPSDYKCLSKKDREDKKAWFSKKKIKPKKKKPKKSNLDVMADALMGKPYYVFLNSEYWSIVRKMVLKRDGHKCIICGSRNKLNIHHDNYKHHFREHNHLNDLMTLCSACHTEHHYCS